MFQDTTVRGSCQPGFCIVEIARKISDLARKNGPEEPGIAPCHEHFFPELVDKSDGVCIPFVWYLAKHTIRAIMAKRVGRQQLLEKAIALFRAKGYSATSIDDVVRACGITKGSLYYHFEGKEDLALAAMAAVHSYFDEHVFSLLPAGGAPSTADLTRFNDAIEEFFVLHPDGCLLANLSLEAGVASAVFGNEIRQFFTDWQACYQRAFARRYPPRTAASMAADALAVVQGCVLMQRINGNIAPLQRQHRRLVELMAAGKPTRRPPA